MGLGNIHKGFGTYYGDLLTYKQALIETEEEFTYSNWSFEATEEFVKDLLEAGVEEILFDLDDDNDYADTVFFKTNEKTDFKSLLSIITAKRPDEFSEESNHHFRMWFD